LFLWPTRLSIGAVHITILLVYRPGSEVVSSLFFDELSSILETLVVLAGPVIIGGDFNVKIQLDDDSGALVSY
jgi:endonuclease/exonuclease/phosphatase (EEP) superfamily protein YafD